MVYGLNVDSLLSQCSDEQLLNGILCEVAGKGVLSDGRCTRNVLADYTTAQDAING